MVRHPLQSGDLDSPSEDLVVFDDQRRDFLCGEAFASTQKDRACLLHYVCTRVNDLARTGRDDLHVCKQRGRLCADAFAREQTWRREFGTTFARV